MDFFGLRDNWVEDFKSQFSIASIIGEATRLFGSGGRLRGRCPFPDHEDRNPSFSVDENRGLFHCFGCGRKGDVISLVQEMDGVDFNEACDRLRWGYRAGLFQGSVPVLEDTKERSLAARKIWGECIPVLDTPAAAYFESRALPVEFVSQQENVRFGELSFDGSSRKHPALVAAVRNLSGEVVAVQRIYLTPAGEKMAVDCKRTLGPVRGASIRLAGLEAPIDAPKDIFLVEGLEDGLSLARCFPEANVWVTLGTSNMANVELPECCTEVTISHDNDDAGRLAAEKAKVRFLKEGKKVNVHSPPPNFKDWNEYLMHWELEYDEYFYNDLPWKYVSEDDVYGSEEDTAGSNEGNSNDNA